MKTTIVIPFFNESERLSEQPIRALAESDLGVIVVDDGSTDDTNAKLSRLASTTPGVIVHRLPRNAGKGEAVRQGILIALENGSDAVGYCDADFATAPPEMIRLVGILRETPRLEVVLGSRVLLLGHDVRRRLFRHLVGRAFATGASYALGIPVYDTQCGAKVFRATNRLRRAVSVAFSSRWVFDVELLDRMLEEVPLEAFLEVPLTSWSDKGGSKLRLPGMLRAGFDLISIAHRRRDRGHRKNVAQ